MISKRKTEYHSEDGWGILLAAGFFIIAALAVLFCRSYETAHAGRFFQEHFFEYGTWLLLVAIIGGLTQLLLVHSRVAFNAKLYPLAIFYSSVGLVALARLKPELFIKQLHWLVFGMVLFLLVLRLRMQWIRLLNYQYMVGILCLLLLGLPLIFGTDIGGSRNWIVLGSLRMQPSEFGKILLVFFLASYLAAHRQVLRLPNRKLLFLYMPPFRFIAPLLAIWGMAILSFVVARDLGSALLFFGIAILMTYIATENKSYLLISVLFFFVGALLSYQFFGHVRVRFDIWLNPWADPVGEAYQIVQSLFAFASGSILGTGYAHGFPTLIPEVHNDFIFAAIGEEFGLIGALSISLSYLCFFYEGMKIAFNCKTERLILLTAGCMIVFFLQTFIIIAGVTKFLPLTGVTLPFISYGGSSMASSFLLLGILVSTSKREDTV